MAKKFSLTASPTFKCKVPVPIPGDKPFDIEFTFKHRNRDDFKAFIENLEGKEDVDLILDCASGWELEDAFDKKNLELLTQNYIGSGREIIETYIKQLASARLGN